MQPVLRHVDPMGGSISPFSHEISPTPVQPHPLRATDEGERDGSLQSTAAESLFSTGVNLLGLQGVGQDKGANTSIDGIPSPRRHVVYEYGNGLFVSGALRNALIVKEREMLERASVPVGPYRLTPVATKAAKRSSGSNGSSILNVNKYSQRAEEFRGVVQGMLKYMRRIESLFTAFAAGASLLSLLMVSAGNRMNPPLDDPVLLYFAIGYEFDGSLFLFLFLLLLIASLTPLSSGVADAQWRHVRRRKRNQAFDSDNENYMTSSEQQQQQQQQRLRSESRVHQNDNAQSSGSRVGVGKTLCSTYAGGRNSALTENQPFSAVGVAGGDSVRAIPYSTASISLASSSPGGDAGTVRGTRRRNMRRLSARDNTLSRRLLGRSWSNPWRVLLVPVVWLHSVGLVFTVLGIALTEGRDPSEVLALHRDHSAAATCLLVVVLIRTVVLFLALLMQLPQLEK